MENRAHSDESTGQVAPLQGFEVLNSPEDPPEAPRLSATYVHSVASQNSRDTRKDVQALIQDATAQHSHGPPLAHDSPILKSQLWWILGTLFHKAAFGSYTDHMAINVYVRENVTLIHKWRNGKIQE